jgi:hypothetical protein
LDNSTSSRSSGNKIVDDTRCTPVYFWQAFAFASGVGGDGFAISPKRMANGCPKIKNGRFSTKPIISEMFTKKFKVKNLQKVVYFRKLIIFSIQLQFFFWLIALSILKNKAS